MQRHPMTDAIMARADAGLSSPKIAAELGLEGRAVRHIIERQLIARKAQAEPVVSRDELSISAQKKLDTAIRQHQRDLDLKFEEAVREKYVADLNRVLPEYEQQQAYCDEVIKARKGVMPRATFRKILACLHPDRGMSNAVLASAFSAFEQLERVLVSEAEMPTRSSHRPKTHAELMEQKRKVSEDRAMRRAKRAGTGMAYR